MDLENLDIITEFYVNMPEPTLQNTEEILLPLQNFSKLKRGNPNLIQETKRVLCKFSKQSSKRVKKEKKTRLLSI